MLSLFQACPCRVSNDALEDDHVEISLCAGGLCIRDHFYRFPERGFCPDRCYRVYRATGAANTKTPTSPDD